MKKVLFFCTALSMNLLVALSQQAHYDVYVMKGCANCQQAHQILAGSNANVNFLHTEELNQGPQMVARLKKLNYFGDITMPVIIKNDSVLLHPSQLVNGSYQPVVLVDVLKSIKNDVAVEVSDIALATITSDCNFVYPQSVFYIVCGSFDSSAQAAHMAKVLLNEGYASASYFLYNGMYRCYCKAFNNLEEAQTLLSEVIKNYRGSYILTEVLK